MRSLLVATKSAPPSDCALEVLDAVPPVVWFIRKHMRANRGELSMAQFRALVRVDSQPDASLSALAEHLGASLSTTSRVVTCLVRKGFLSRCDCTEDRRQLSLALTPRGRKVLDHAWAGTRTKMDEELNKLSPAQRHTITHAMAILKSSFGSAGLPLPSRTPTSED